MSIEYLHCVDCHTYTDINLMSWWKVRNEKGDVEYMKRICGSCYRHLELEKKYNDDGERQKK